MSRKYKVTLPGPVAEQLEELAAASELAPSTLAGHFVGREVARAAADGAVRPLRRLPLTVGVPQSGGRGRWLEPYGGDADWRADMWGQIVALHGRYPRALAWLQEGWWRDEEQTETLWRSRPGGLSLPPPASNAREELAFHLQLRELSQVPRQAGGGVTKAWKPGALPEEW